MVRYEMAMIAHKIKNKLIKSDIKIEYNSERHGYDLRNAGYIHQHSFRTDIGRTDIAVEHNTLPNELKNISKLDTFKFKLKKIIIMQN